MKPILAMKRILLLGGTTEALAIARTLNQDHIYSLAGLGKIPQDLNCAVRVGGFGGVQGLTDFIKAQHIDLLVDATHPYAAKMSSNAAAAAEIAEIPCWALRRAEWQAGAGDEWRFVEDWHGLVQALEHFHRPFFTLGREPLAHLDAIPATQFWTIRCLDAQPGNARCNVIGARGPFALEQERDLFAGNDFDVLISKNSGSEATEHKLQVARERKLPVLILKRPDLPNVTREFDSVAKLHTALEELGT